MTPRSFAEHTTLLCAFASQVDALPAETWQRVAERCRPLAGTTPAALLARAQLRAAPQMQVPTDELSGLARAIPFAMRLSVVTMSLTYEADVRDGRVGVPVYPGGARYEARVDRARRVRPPH